MNFFGLKNTDPKLLKNVFFLTSIKKTFQDFLDKGEIPNYALAGPPGCGKDHGSKSTLQELGVDYYVINGSDEGRFLDTVRNNAKNFASTVSLSSTAKHKVIIIDEADNTTQMYNSSYGRLLRSLVATADSSLPATTKTKFSNHFIPDVHGCRVLH